MRGILHGIPFLVKDVSISPVTAICTISLTVYMQNMCTKDKVQTTAGSTGKPPI